MNASRVAAVAFPANIFSAAASPAHSIRELAVLTLVITGSIFLAIATLLVVAILRFRERPGDNLREPVQMYGSNQIEISWTAIPILIVLVLFLATARVIIATETVHAATWCHAGNGCRPPVLVRVPVPGDERGVGERAAHTGR